MSKVADETLFRLVHDFLVIYLPSQRNSSPHTIRTYRTSIEMLLDFVKRQNDIPLGKVSFRMLSEKMVTAFLDSLETERGCGISTRNHRLKCVRAFLKYAAMIDPTAVAHQSELFKVPIMSSISILPDVGGLHNILDTTRKAYAQGGSGYFCRRHIKCFLPRKPC